jgi:hypothetical protein
MQFNRREFIGLGSLLLGSPVLASHGQDTSSALFLSAASNSRDEHWIVGFRWQAEQAVPVFQHALPGRAHHIAIHEGLGIYIVIARRPGSYLWIGDLESGAFLAEITVPDDRHLFGHGVFSADGSRFYAPESDWQDMTGDSGRIVSWQVRRSSDSVSMERLDEHPSYGVGPHEILLMPDQDTLVVANGGIRTHPETGREKLNIDTMQPSLVYMSASTGQLFEQRFLEEHYHQASIRHMDQTADGLIAFGIQYEGEPFDSVPLIATHRRGEAIRTLWAPEPQQGQMSQYVGSVRFDNGGRVFAASCPRGNMITFWDSERGEMIDAVRSRDGCGICAMESGFLFTTGTGRIAWYDPVQAVTRDVNAEGFDKLFWDNHLSMVNPAMKG